MLNVGLLRDCKRFRNEFSYHNFAFSSFPFPPCCFVCWKKLPVFFTNSHRPLYLTTTLVTQITRMCTGFSLTLLWSKPFTH